MLQCEGAWSFVWGNKPTNPPPVAKGLGFSLGALQLRYARTRVSSAWKRLTEWETTLIFFRQAVSTGLVLAAREKNLVTPAFGAVALF